MNLPMESKLLDVTPALVRNLDGQIIYWSGGMQKLFGWTSSEVLGKNYGQLLQTIFPLPLTELQQQLLENGEWQGNVTCTGKDGARLYLQSTWVLMPDKGNVIEIAHISRRKPSTEVLPERREHYRLIQENSLDAILLTSSDGSILSANPAACQMFQMTEAEICRAGRDRLVDLHDPHLPILLKERKRTGNVRGELTMIRKDGSRFPVEITSSAFVNRNGEERTSMIIRDITARRQADQEILKRNVNLTLLNSINAAVNRGENLSAIISLISNTTRDMFHGYGAVLYLIDEENHRLVMQNQVIPAGLVKNIEKMIGMSIPHFRHDLRLTTPYRQVVENGKSLLINDIAGIHDLMAAYALSPQLADKTRARIMGLIPSIVNLIGLKSVMIVPMVADNRVIGTIEIGNTEPFTGDDLQRLETIAGQMTAAIEHKRAVEALRSRESMLQQIFDILPVGLWFADKDGKLLRGNPAGVKIWGAEPKVSPSEYGIFKARRLPSREEVEPDDWALAHTIRDKVTIVDELLEIDALDGRQKTILNYTAPLINSLGEVQGAIVVNLDITDRIHAEKALQESEEKYKSLFNSASDGFMIMNQTTFLDCNAAIEKIFRCSRDLMVSHSPVDLSPEQQPDGRLSRESAREKIDAAMKGESQTFEWLHTRPDGTTFMAEVSLSRFSIGGEFMLQAIVRDISERKQAEDNLRRSEAQLRIILDATPFPIALVNLEGNKIEYWSRSALDLFGHTAPNADEWYQMAYPDPDYRRQVIDQWEPALEKARISGQAVNTGKYRVTCRDGSVRICELYAAFLADRLIVTFNDVTDLMQHQQALRESEDRFRAIASNTPDHILVQDNHLKYTYVVNPQLGLTEIDMIGKTDSDFLSANDADKLTQVKRRVMQTGKPERFDTSLVSKSGEVQSFEGTYIPQLGADGKAYGLLGYFRNVTDLLKSQQALRESEERWRSLVAATPDYIALFDKKARYLYLNHYAAGFSEKDVIGKKAFDFITPESTTLYKNMFEECLKTGQLVKFEFKGLGDQKAFRVYEQYLVPITNRENETIIMAVARDITDRKQVEEALRENEIRYRNIFEGVQDAIFVESASGRILDVNQRACEIYEITREQFLAKSVSDIVPVGENIVMFDPDDPSSCPNHPIETVNIRASGELFPIELLFSVQKQKNGNVLLVVGRDITERKRAEQELAASNARFRALFEQAAVGVAQLDTQSGRYISINQKFCDFLGYTREELLTKSSQDVTHPEDTQKHMDFKALLLAGKITEYSLDKRYIRKDGSIVWGNLTVSPMWKPGEKPGIYIHIAVVQDITDRKKAEEKLKDYNRRLEADVEERTQELRDAQEQLVRKEKLAVLGQLAGGVGHELRNPLAVILNAIYYLKMVQPKADDKVKQYLGMIEIEARNAEKIISDLLDFSRIKSVDREPLLIPDVVQRVLERFPAPGSIQVSLEFPAELPRVFVDGRQLEQVFGNLVVNAYQAMPEGGKLMISSKIKEKEITIFVTDTGTGITPQNMERLFEPLFTTKTKGIGLGLAVSKKLIEANNGKIEVHSEIDKGTTFTVFLPIKP